VNIFYFFSRAAKPPTTPPKCSEAEKRCRSKLVLKLAN
jgi:hypothetical protein